MNYLSRMGNLEVREQELMSDMCSYPNCEISSSVSMLLLNILPDWGLPPCLFSIYIPYDS